MKKYLFRVQGSKKQYIIGIGAAVIVAPLGLLLRNIIGYRVIAFMLPVTVSVLAMFLDIVSALVAAILSAVFWNFLFIPPRFTLTVGTPEDRILLLKYFIIARKSRTNRMRNVKLIIRFKQPE